MNRVQCALLSVLVVVPACSKVSPGRPDALAPEAQQGALLRLVPVLGTGSSDTLRLRVYLANESPEEFEALEVVASKEGVLPQFLLRVSAALEDEPLMELRAANHTYGPMAVPHWVVQVAAARSVVPAHEERHIGDLVVPFEKSGRYRIWAALLKRWCAGSRGGKVHGDDILARSPVLRVEHE